MTTEASASPIQKLINPGASTMTGAAAATGANQTLGATDFLSLLTTELKNQDPLNPVDSTQSVAQLAQFSALQATTKLSSDFNKFESNSAVIGASGLLGDRVMVSTSDASGNATTVGGTVKSIAVVNGLPQFTMVDSSGNPVADGHGNPIQFATSQIIGIAK